MGRPFASRAVWSTWQLELGGEEAYCGHIFDGGLIAETERDDDGSTVFAGYVG